MKARFLVFLLGMCCYVPLHAQPLQPVVGLDLQAYPAGQIGVVQGAWPVASQHLVGLHAGYNRTRRQDFGKHDDECGGGPGFGGRWRYFLNDQQTGFHAGTRLDVWFLEIDWREDDPARLVREGTTDITVVQPTAQVGYGWLIANDRLTVDATISLGVEINVRTDGDPVGEGAILLGGLSLSYRL